MPPAAFRFDRFVLDARERRLTRDGAPVDVGGRYLDALALLVSEQGKLVSKDRLLEEVWQGVPVTDEALTQCVKMLRRQLGDDAARPRFIETVPRHGYRFILPVEPLGEEAGPPPPDRPPAAALPGSWRRALLLGGAGTVGGGAAGILGGLLYGFVGALHPGQPSVGAASLILVLTCLTVLIGVLGGAGVAFGVAAAGLRSARPGPRSIVGGAAGGLVVGALAKLLGLDAFDLLFGRTPGDITGPFEGALLGAGIGAGAWLADRGGRRIALGRHLAVAALTSGAAGVLVALSGGRLLGGSLDLLARRFPESRLRLDGIGGLFGEAGFGRVTQIVTSGLEAALFGAGVVGALLLARRSLDEVE